MSEFNSILTDKDLRGLLQQYMLENDNALTDQMIEMESRIAFGTVPAVALVMPNETEMIGKLTKSFAGKTGFYTWTIGLGVSVALGVGIYTYTQKGNGTTPSQEENNIPVKEQVVPDVAPGNVPVSPHQANYPLAMVDTLGKKQNLPDENISPTFLGNENFKADPLLVVITPPLCEKEDPNETKVVKPNPDPVVLKTDTKKPKDERNTTIDTVFTGVKKIVIDAGICDLSVVKGSTDKVTLKGGITIETKGLVTKKPEYDIKYERKNEVLKVWVEQGQGCGVMVGSINIDASLNMEIPQGTDVDISNTSGNINLSGLDGRLCKVKSNYGNISAEKINTGFSLSAQSGNISITGCNGGADLMSTYGNVSVNDHKGNMKIKVSSGNVTVKGLTGDNCEVVSTYGNVSLAAITAPVQLTATSGDVQLDQVQGNVLIESTYGNQRIHSVVGNIESSSASGDVKIDDLKGDLNIRSTYGNINATACNGNIKVKSQSGDIKGKNIHIQDALELSATYGDIRMQLDNPLNDLSFDLMAVSGDVSVKKEGTNLKGEEGKLHLEKGKIKIKGNTTSGDQVYE